MIAATIPDPLVQQHLETVSRDGMDSFVLARGSLRGAAVNATRLVNQMRANHGLGILETLILGHGLIGAALMSSSLKGGDRMQVDFEVDGPVGGIVVDANARGEVRGYLRTESIPVEEPLKSFDTSPFIGNGFVKVTRYPEKGKRPYSGTVVLEHGTIAQDLARYYLESEQTPSVLNLSIQFDSDGRVIGAGGLLVQALPGDQRAETIDEDGNRMLRAEVEDRVVSMQSIGEALSRGQTTTTIVQEALGAFEPAHLGSRPAEFRCGCSPDRFRRVLEWLPQAEKDDIRRNGPFPLQTTCVYCNSTYEFSRAEVEAFLDTTSQQTAENPQEESGAADDE